VSTGATVAVVTGAAGGIGEAVARRLAADGTRVVAADRNGEALGATVARLADIGSPVTAAPGDVGDASAVADLFDAVRAIGGRLEVLVNTAGIAHGPESERHFLESDPEQWDRLVAANLRSVYLCARHAAELMAAARRGVIVNLSSAGATQAHRHRVAYDATKGAIEAATRALALDLAPWGIRVNAVAPGAIAVPNRSPIGRGGRDPSPDLIPLGRLGTPEDVAGAVAYLVSDDAAYVTGAVLAVDGGLTSQLRPPAMDLPPPDLPDRPTDGGSR
jgi:NAD(P)-dependent dehydrogenase (short-subunit alcohol dehydrogenase family)